MATYSRRGLHGRVVHDIGLRILRGDLEPGATLDTEAVEREYDVSRTVVREAIKVLAAKGLLDARPKRGTVVRERDAWNLLDPDVVAWQFEGAPDPRFIAALDELRQVFEPGGARLAAERAGARDIAALETALEAMRRHHGNVAAVIADDVRLHRAILAATGNELLLRFETLIEAGVKMRNQLTLPFTTEPDYIELHAAVVAAIKRRDPDGAETAMRALLQSAAHDAAAAVAKSRDTPRRE